MKPGIALEKLVTESIGLLENLQRIRAVARTTEPEAEAPPGPTQSVEVDAIFHEWSDLWRRRPWSDAITDQLVDLEDEIAEFRADTLRTFAIKVLMCRDLIEGDGGLGPSIIEDAEHFLSPASV